jgi:glycosyltransferase involved in cell wall biosynthesis
MPVYNRPDRLVRALQQIRGQTYRNLRIIVSDNASPDPAVREFLEQAARDDDRVVYHRQKTNIGLVGNFQYVLREAESDFFMWAADDDQYAPTFVETCMAAHLRNPELGLSFTRYERVDARGRKNREVADATQYNGHPGWPLLRRLVAEPEVGGRANLVYGVWRRSLAVELMSLPFPWHRYAGSDGPFTAAALLRAAYYADAKILFRKVFSDPDCGDEVRYQHMDFARPEPWYYARFHRNPAALYGYLLALRGTRFFAVGCILLGFRFAWEVYREVRAASRKIGGRLKILGGSSKVVR